MRSHPYIKTSNDMVELSHAKSIGAGRAILNTVAAKRDAVREENENRPQISDDIKKDYRFKAGMVAALNWVLGLPDEARTFIERGEPS